MTGRPALKLAFYGDDLTGSTDAMEALCVMGMPARLYLSAPHADDLAESPGIEAVGLAGTSRAKNPAWMDAHLPAALRALAALGAPLIHYKVCSTFDSGPDIGNIGRVLEIGLRVFGCRRVPIVVGAPALGRYCAFGHLFASDKDREVSRIDRHPVMSVHPKTPMAEADLRRHLARQTGVPVALIDFRMLAARQAGGKLAALPAECGVLIDNLDAASEIAVGHLLEDFPFARLPGFVIGSSGVEYALMAANPRARPVFAHPGAVTQMLALSGSGSQTTAAQIAHAVQAGWLVLDLPPERLLAEGAALEERLAQDALAGVAAGRSVLVATTRGDPAALAASAALMASRGIDSAEMLGGALGRIGHAVLSRARALRRVALMGGDTSGAAALAMGIAALDMLAPLVAGSPLCRAHASDRVVDGLEIVFKGGQIGRDAYLDTVLAGDATT